MWLAERLWKIENYNLYYKNACYSILFRESLGFIMVVCEFFQRKALWSINRLSNAVLRGTSDIQGFEKAHVPIIHCLLPKVMNTRTVIPQ